MKANMKIFKSLTREPDISQTVSGKPFNLYFATDEEIREILVGDMTSVLSTDGKEYRLLIERDAYDYKSCKHYFEEEVNGYRVELIEKVSKIQKISLFGIMLPLALVLLVVVSLILGLKDKFGSGATWLIAALMALLFSVSFTTNRTLKQTVEKYQGEMEDKITKHLGKDKVNELSKDLEEYAKNKYQKSMQHIAVNQEAPKQEETKEKEKDKKEDADKK